MQFDKRKPRGRDTPAWPSTKSGRELDSEIAPAETRAWSQRGSTPEQGRASRNITPCAAPSSRVSNGRPRDGRRTRVRQCPNSNETDTRRGWRVQRKAGRRRRI